LLIIDEGGFMTRRNRIALIFFYILLLPLVSATTEAQPLPRVVASGLMAPSKLLALPHGPILVAESGNGPNTGRVSMVDSSGGRTTLIDGLPAGLSAPNNDPAGVSGLAFKNRTLFLSISAGDSVMVGPAPGSELPNPRSSSPIFSSVLALEFDRSLNAVGGGFLVVPADHAILASGKSITMKNPLGQSATLRLVIDIPDHVPLPRPDVPNNVRVSNPFGLELADSCGLWLVDASQNLIWKVDWCSNTYSEAVTFPQYANPLPVGARQIDAVPTSARSHDGAVLVTFLTGFPFPPGLAEVRLVKPASGESEVMFRGHRMLIDVLVSDRTPDGFFVLEYSQDVPAAMLPGRLIFYDSRSAAPVVVSSNLMGPTNMALSPFADEVLITEILTGRIVAVSLP
jgi:hypothetical protein